jgi:hypothetical protein
MHGARLLRIACLGLALLLALCGVAMIAWRVSTRDQPPDAPELTRVGKAPESFTESSCIEDRDAQLLLTASRLDPHAAILSLDAALCTPPGLLDRLVFGKKERPILARNGDLRPEFENARVAVTLTGNFPPYTGRLHGRLARLAEQSIPSPEESSRVPIGRASLPLVGEPGSYPLDWFSFDGYYALHLPPGVRVRRSGSLAQLLGPVEVRVLAGAGVGDLHVMAGQRNQGQFTIRITRETSTQWYVLLLLAIPMLFVLLLALGAHRIGQGAQSRDAVLGALAAALALLPIRQALVPDDIGGLTLVDWTLGTIVLLFAAVALLWIGTGLGAPRGRSS